jgi:hypothetical protein
MVGTTIAIITLVGMGISAYSTWKAGQAAKQAGEHQQEAANSQADLTDTNADTSTAQAEDAIARGAEEESRFRTQVRGAIGSQRAQIAANNIDVSYGSAVDVQADAAQLGELDALTVRTNAAREAWGYNVQAADLHARAAIQRKEGINAAEAGAQGQSAANWAMAGNLIGGSASLLQMRYGFDRAGGTSTGRYVPGTGRIPYR